MIEFSSTIYGTVHAFAVAEDGKTGPVTRSIAAQARRHGAAGPALRKVFSRPDTSGRVIVQVAYRAL